MVKQLILQLAILSVVWVASAEAAMERINLAYASSSVSNIPIRIAYELKYFQKHGIDPTLVYITSATTVTQAMLAGEVRFAQMGIGPAILASLKSRDGFVALAESVNRIPYDLAVSGKIPEGASLKGKRWGISRFGASSDLILRLALKEVGVNPEKEAVIVQVGSVPARMAALQSGSIDGTLLESPSSLVAEGLGMRVVKRLTGVNMPYFHTGLIALQSYATKNPDLVQRVVNAYAEAIRTLRQDKEATMQVLTKTFGLRRGPALDEAYDLFSKQLIDADPSPSKEGIRTVLKMLRNPELENVDPARFIDSSFIKKATASGSKL